eukprot:4434417-Pyramimonas_sp.AAC.1
MLQPSCRAPGPPSNYNYKVNHSTWEQHHKEDLPHIAYCGKIAVTQECTEVVYTRTTHRNMGGRNFPMERTCQPTTYHNRTHRPMRDGT